MKWLLCFIGLLICILAYPGQAQAVVVSDYKILSSETVIDTINTTALVDTTAHKISLPQTNGGRRISYSGNDYDYVALTGTSAIQYSFNGTSMVGNTVASVSGLTNPLAVFASSPYPDVVVATSTDIKHYSFDGTSAMNENPALAVSGLTSVASVSTRGPDVAALDNGQLKYYGFNGTNMSQIPGLSISSGLSSPVDIALFPNSYNVAVLETDRVRFFYFNGSGLTEIPSLALTGFTNPLKSIAVNENIVSVIDGNQVKSYAFDGTSYSYSAALSITSSLAAPSCVVLRPGSNDIIVADGDNVKYYMNDGTKMVYNAALSVQVTGLSGNVRYLADATVRSINFTLAKNTQSSRVTATCNVPNNTSITWSVLISSIYTNVWRLRGSPTGSILEYTTDGGTSWTPIGTAANAVPGVSTAQLWISPATSPVGWKADLHTDDPTVSPQIIAANPGVDTAIRMEVNNPPTVIINTSASCYLTMTPPPITWTYADADGDPQAADAVKITADVDGGATYFSANGIGSANSYTIPPSQDPANPSGLWTSGANTFRFWVGVSDGMTWTWNYNVICFHAFERPRIAELSVPGDGYISPFFGIPSTHKVITMGMSAAQLPVTKAGGRVSLLIDSIGGVDLNPATVGSVAFPYLAQTATLSSVSLQATQPGGGSNRQWLLQFWTDPDITVCPDNTVVQMSLFGTYGTDYPAFNIPPFATGVVSTKGSVYDNWIVVLQGSNQKSKNY
jgi:hypothetical protein